MLTDQQIEQAARKLCELRGIDPDIYVRIREDTLATALTVCSVEIRAADQVREVIDYAENDAPGTFRGAVRMLLGKREPGQCGHCGHEDRGHYPQGCVIGGCHCAVFVSNEPPPFCPPPGPREAVNCNQGFPLAQHWTKDEGGKIKKERCSSGCNALAAGPCECGHSHAGHTLILATGKMRCEHCKCAGYFEARKINAGESFNLCSNCQHEWRYHEIHQGRCVGSLNPACECQNKQPRI